MPIPDKYHLTIPSFDPTTDADHAANMRALDRWGNALPFTYMDAININCSAGFTTSTTYVNVPGTSITMPFRKQSPDTRLFATGGLSVFYDSSANFSRIQLGVNINSVDYDIDSFVEIGANLRGAMHGTTNPISNLPIGLYTVTLRVKIANGQLNVDSFGSGSIVVIETL